MRTLTLAVCLATLTTNVQASHVYEFIQEGTGDTLAYWELSSLPAGHEEVISLTFTPIGEAMFGLGEHYDGEFDGWVQDQAMDDGMGGLGNSGNHEIDPSIFDVEDAPISTLAIGANEATMNLRYGTDPGEDRIWYSFDSPGSIIADGDWRLVAVPEPHTLAILSTSVLICALRR